MQLEYPLNYGKRIGIEDRQRSPILRYFSGVTSDNKRRCRAGAVGHGIAYRDTSALERILHGSSGRQAYESSGNQKSDAASRVAKQASESEPEDLAYLRDRLVGSDLIGFKGLLLGSGVGFSLLLSYLSIKISRYSTCVKIVGCLPTLRTSPTYITLRQPFKVLR